MGLFSRIDWGSTRIDTTSADGYWTRSVSDYEPGAVDMAVFTVPGAWLGGEHEVAPPLPGGRRFAFMVDSVRTGSPSDTSGAEFDEIGSLNALFNVGAAAEVELKTQRTDASGATVSRSIWVRCMAAYPYQIIPDISGTGVVAKRQSARVRYRVECYARSPYWRDTSASTTTIVATTSGVTGAIVNAGMPCGVLATITAKSGSPTQLVIANDQNAYVATFTTVTVANFVDANHADPTGVSFSSGVQYDSYLRIATGTNTFTGTTTGGTSATFTLDYRRCWATP